jgi:hypothetical protein
MFFDVDAQEKRKQRQRAMLTKEVNKEFMSDIIPPYPLPPGGRAKWGLQ